MTPTRASIVAVAWVTVGNRSILSEFQLESQLLLPIWLPNNIPGKALGRRVLGTQIFKYAEIKSLKIKIKINLHTKF